VTIWRTIRQYFIAHGVPMDYALFSSCEAPDRALLDGAIGFLQRSVGLGGQSCLQKPGCPSKQYSRCLVGP
jgi:hypothetical protein